MSDYVGIQGQAVINTGTDPYRNQMLMVKFGITMLLTLLKFQMNLQRVPGQRVGI
jgi:hypothetical protein